MKAQLLLAGIILGMSGISACTGNKKNVMTEKETMDRGCVKKPCLASDERSRARFFVVKSVNGFFRIY